MSKRKHWWNRNKRIPCVKCDAKGRDHLGPCPWCIGRGYRMRYQTAAISTAEAARCC